jgi:acyl-CoA reductase-like NAD-dependent aldehyde dehydrogenase
LLGVPWTKYTPQNQGCTKKEETKTDALFMARVKKATKAKKKAKQAKKDNKARKRRDRKEMLKRTKDQANETIKQKRDKRGHTVVKSEVKPVVNKITEDDMFELQLDSLINRAKMELRNC